MDNCEICKRTIAEEYGIVVSINDRRIKKAKLLFFCCSQHLKQRLEEIVNNGLI